MRINDTQEITSDQTNRRLRSCCERQPIDQVYQITDHVVLFWVRRQLNRLGIEYIPDDTWLDQLIGRMGGPLPASIEFTSEVAKRVLLHWSWLTRIEGWLAPDPPGWDRFPELRREMV